MDGDDAQLHKNEEALNRLTDRVARLEKDFQKYKENQKEWLPKEDFQEYKNNQSDWKRKGLEALVIIVSVLLGSILSDVIFA